MRGRVALRIYYRTATHELSVRADHGEASILERTMKTEGDDAAVLREASLLASNLARDEARELLDALALRPSRRPVVPAPALDAPVVVPPASLSPQPDYGATFALVYPLATNVGHPDVTSHLDLSLFFGRVGHVEGTQVGGLVTFAGRGLRGAQVSTVASVVDGDLDGVQVGGLIAVAHGKSKGVQVAATVNLSTGDASGVQFAGSINLARAKMTGVQVAGIANFAMSATGAQVATLNVAKDADAVQAGVVNVASDVTGAQLGLVNIGRRVKGAQIGLVNIADEIDGQAIGLISISRNNIHPVVWGSNLVYSGAGIKFTGRSLYTRLGLTFGSLDTGFRNIGLSTALGTHFLVTPISESLDVEPEVDLTTISLEENGNKNNLWCTTRMNIGYSFADHLRVFVGTGARFPGIVSRGRSIVRPEVLAGVQF